MKYIISSQEKPQNYPLYSVHSDLDSFILYNYGDLDNQIAQLEDDASSLKENQTITEENKITNLICPN